MDHGQDDKMVWLGSWSSGLVRVWARGIISAHTRHRARLGLELGSTDRFAPRWARQLIINVDNNNTFYYNSTDITKRLMMGAAPHQHINTGVPHSDMHGCRTTSTHREQWFNSVIPQLGIF